MPLTPFIVEGTVRKGIHEGFTEITALVSGSGGMTINLYVSDGTEVAASQLITLTRVSSSEILTATTDVNGQYMIDLSNLTSYSAGDSIKVKVDTRSTTIYTQEMVHRGANAQKSILLDKRGKEYDEDYPYPVFIADRLNGHPDVWGNVETAWIITRGDGQPDSETVTYPNGDSFKRTYGYDSNGMVNYRSRWQKQ